MLGKNLDDRSEDDDERTMTPLSLPESDLLSAIVSRPPATERDLNRPRLTVDTVVAFWAAAGATVLESLSFLRRAWILSWEERRKRNWGEMDINNRLG